MSRVQMNTMEVGGGKSKSRGPGRGGLEGGLGLQTPVEVTEVEESADLDLEREIVQLENEINHTVIIHTANPRNLRRHDSSIPAQRLGPEDDIFIEDIE